MREFWSSYSYVGSNPVNAWDPDGRFRVFAHQQRVYQGYDEHYQPKSRVVTSYSLVRGVDYESSMGGIKKVAKMLYNVPLLGKMIGFFFEETIGTPAKGYEGSIWSEALFDKQIAPEDFGKLFSEKGFSSKMEKFREFKGKENVRPTSAVMEEAREGMPMPLEEK